MMFNFFYQSSSFRKSLVTVLIIAMFFISGGYALFLPKIAQAQWTDVGHIAFQAGKWVWEGIEWAWEKAKVAASFVAQHISTVLNMEERAEHWADLAMQIIIETTLRVLLAQITNDIIDWVNNGYKGKPAFMSTSFGSYIGDALNTAGGNFVDQFLGAGYLCDEFDLKLKIPLLNEHTFDTKVRCTLKDIGVNLTKFYDDFATGGWTGWIELSRPQNSFYGAVLMAQSEKSEVEEDAKEEADRDASMGGGFLSIYKCTWRDANGNFVEEHDGVRGKTSTPDKCLPGNAEKAGFTRPCNEVCVMQTPGSAVSNIVNKNLTSGMERINMTLANLTAKGGSFFKPYIMAIGEAMVNKLITDGLANLKQSGPTKDNPTAPLPTGTSLASTTGSTGRLALPSDTREEMVPVTTLLLNLESIHKKLKTYWINQQKVYNLVKKLKTTDEFIDVYQRDLKETPSQYKPVEFFSEFDYLYPVLNKSITWDNLCKDCQREEAFCNKYFYPRRNSLIAFFTDEFTEDGVTKRRISFEEYDKVTTNTKDEVVEEKDYWGDLIKTVATKVDETTANYSFSILDLIDDGLLDSKITVKKVDIKELMTYIDINSLEKKYWASYNSTSYSIAPTSYFWVDWFIDVNDQSGASIDTLRTSTAQEVVAHTEAVLDNFIKQFETGPAETEVMISKTEEAIDYLDKEYIPSAEKYLDLYEQHIENFDDPDLVAAENDMLAKRKIAIEKTKEVNQPNNFTSENFDDLNKDVSELAEELAEKDGRLIQMLGDKDYPSESGLYGLIEAVDLLGVHMAELYYKCKTGVTPFNDLSLPFQNIW